MGGLRTCFALRFKQISPSLTVTSIPISQINTKKKSNKPVKKRNLYFFSKYIFFNFLDSYNNDILHRFSSTIWLHGCEV